VARRSFRFLLHIDTGGATKSTLGELRTWWFALALYRFGLETRFTDLVKMEGGRPALAFIVAQAFNVVWTLGLAYLLFGGVLFDVPDIKCSTVSAGDYWKSVRKGGDRDEKDTDSRIGNGICSRGALVFCR